MTDKPETALVVAPKEQAIARAMTADEMESQIRAYFEMQKLLDRSLPDSIMRIQGRQFRKKSYWRAIAVAFGIELELVAEQRVKVDSTWGYTATYRASLPSGRSMCGDGTCMASEKRGSSCTEHNVRSHCHTRAKNRAIADLVGFGEVTAEEVGPDGPDDDTTDGEFNAVAPAVTANPQVDDKPAPSLQDIKRLADSLGVPEGARKELAIKHGVTKKSSSPVSLRALFADIANFEVKHD